MTDAHLVFADSPAAVARAARDHAQATIVTDNPLLAADPSVAVPVVNIDAAMDQPTVLALGRRALTITAEIDARLAAPAVAERFGCLAGHLNLGGSVSRLISSLMYRATVMARALETHAPGRLSLLVAGAPTAEPSNPVLPHRFACPYPSLAAAGFFGDLAVDTATVETPLPAAVNQTAIRGILRRAAMTPLPVLLQELVRRSGLARIWGRREILVADDNEALRECLPWLALAGWRLRPVGKLTAAMSAPPLPATAGAPLADPDDLPEAPEAWLAGAIAAGGTLDATRAAAVARVVRQHLGAGLRHLGGQSAAIARRLDAIMPAKGRRPVILTNGLFGPAGAQAYGQLRARGALVAGFEHGTTTGLSAVSQARIGWSEATSCDLLLVSSDGAAAAFGEAGRGRELRIATIGLADQTRRLLRPRLQRHLARRRLGLTDKRPVVMHASTWPRYGNFRTGHGVPGETVTFELDRRLITGVYAGLPQRVVFKPYPTQRFPHEPAYEKLFPAPENLIYAPDEDFRYIRAAADVIVTATPTSTLGWCIGTGVPLIWLDSALINPLVDDDLRQAFRESFLVIDLDQPDWSKRLRTLLEDGIDGIRAGWAARADRRQVLLETAIAGPAGSPGRRAARLIDALASDRDAAWKAGRTPVMQP